MTLHLFRSNSPLSSLAGMGIVSILATGCGPKSAVDQPLPEIRGAPIRMVATKTADQKPSTNATSVVSKASASLTPAPQTTANPTPSALGASEQALSLTFDQLGGYTFEVTDELLGPVTNDLAAAAQKTNSKIPQGVKSYDQKKVALRGFMLPLKVEGGLVTEMLIMKDQTMCCYGATPRINDWVSVRMKNKGVRPLMDLPVTLFGTMRVGEMRENGYLVGIYSMDGESLEAPEGQ
jgi:hypothetical protein